jgi:hypothetical protein
MGGVGQFDRLSGDMITLHVDEAPLGEGIL